MQKVIKMAKPNRLRELEHTHGDLNEVIPALVNAYGQAEAARQLGVSGATISVWLRDHGYVQQTQYVRPEMEVSP